MTLPIILFIFIIAAFVGLALEIKKDAKKAKDFVVTTDGILLFIAFLSIVCMMIDDMVFKNDLFGSPVMNIALLTFLGSIALILLFTAVLIVKISGSKSK